MAKLGVNIDHVATIRQARRGVEPDPVWAAAQAELAGADGITLHLREDRRHIQDRDARLLRQTVQTKYNLEMAATPEMVALAIELNADQVTLVPERREEVTTEGGLDVVASRSRIELVTHQLKNAGIEVSLFIDPNPDQVVASKECGAHGIELHTGCYANARDEAENQTELIKLVQAGRLTRELGLKLHAGHGLNYQNVMPVARIEEMGELNIGHSIISRAVFVGIGQAVREMKQLINDASRRPS
jgi:pyridoxine 5-phosphate synthase